ncbi:MAG: VRR-NUC domain-containing protein [Treponema sp.]|jgi:hypothetical protein|nr:VRR-NUC domain-containing protein [Treponema sp.]
MSKGTTPESVVLAGCLNYLEKRGIYHWRNSVGAVRIGPGRFIRFGKVGSSDVLGCLPGGRLLCVECKAEHGRLSPEQKQFLEDIRGLGGLAIVARSWMDIAASLREAGYSGITDGPLFGRED